MSFEDTGAGFDGGGFDESAFDDPFSDFNPTTGDTGSLPDPNTTIDPGNTTVFSDPTGFGNDPTGGLADFSPPADTTIAPGYDSPPDPLGGAIGFDLPGGNGDLAGTPADVPGGTMGTGTLPGSGTEDNGAIADILTTTGNVLGGLLGGIGGILNGGASKGIGGSGKPSGGSQAGSPSSPGNAKSPTASTVGFIDVNNQDTIGLYLVVGLLAFVLWRR